MIFPFVAHIVSLFCLVTIIFRETLYVSVFLDCHINWTNTNLFILVHTPTNTICFLNYFRYSGHLSIPICETCISMSSLLLDSTVLRQWQQHTASHFMSHKMWYSNLQIKCETVKQKYSSLSCLERIEYFKARFLTMANLSRLSK